MVFVAWPATLTAPVCCGFSAHCGQNCAVPTAADARTLMLVRTRVRRRRGTGIGYLRREEWPSERRDATPRYRPPTCAYEHLMELRKAARVEFANQRMGRRRHRS